MPIRIRFFEAAEWAENEPDAGLSARNIAPASIVLLSLPDVARINILALVDRDDDEDWDLAPGTLTYSISVTGPDGSTAFQSPPQSADIGGHVRGLPWRTFLIFHLELPVTQYGPHHTTFEVRDSESACAVQRTWWLRDIAASDASIEYGA